jgi:hypothetical protein
MAAYADLNTDDLIRLTTEVINGTPVSKSKVKDSPAVRAFREEVAQEIADHFASNPDAEIELPHEAGDDPEPYPNGKPKPPSAGPAREASDSITVLPLTDEERATLDLLEKAAGDHFYGPWKGGKASSGGGPATVSVDEAIKQLEEGKRPSIARDDVGAFMDKCATRKDHLDLTEVKVYGTLKFGGDGLGVARKDMPQLSGGDLDKYMGELRGRGITVSTGTIAPQQLKPIQKEVSATASAGIMQAMRRGEYDMSKTVVISKDNFVLDGHHRWGAATAFSFEDKSFRLPFVRIGMDAKPLLADATSWTQKAGIANKALGESRYALTTDERDLIELMEKGDDHFYGGWKGGKSGAGGGPAGASQDGGLKAQSVTGREMNRDLGSRDISKISDSMEGSLGKEAEMRYYDPSALTTTGPDESVAQFRAKGKVTRVTAPNRSQGEMHYHVQMDIGDSKTIIIPTTAVAAFSVAAPVKTASASKAPRPTSAWNGPGVKNGRFALTPQERASGLKIDPFTGVLSKEAAAPLAEKSSTDHPYGAWRGGKAGAGGGMEGKSHEGGMTAQAIDSGEMRSDLAKRDVTKISDAMEGTVGQEVECTFYSKHDRLNTGPGDPATKFTYKGTVERIDRGPAGHNMAVIGLKDGTRTRPGRPRSRPLLCRRQGRPGWPRRPPTLPTRPRWRATSPSTRWPSLGGRTSGSSAAAARRLPSPRTGPATWPSSTRAHASTGS